MPKHPARPDRNFRTIVGVLFPGAPWLPPRTESEPAAAPKPSRKIRRQPKREKDSGRRDSI